MLYDGKAPANERRDDWGLVGVFVPSKDGDEGDEREVKVCDVCSAGCAAEAAVSLTVDVMRPRVGLVLRHKLVWVAWRDAVVTP